VETHTTATVHVEADIIPSAYGPTTIANGAARVLFDRTEQITRRCFEPFHAGDDPALT
jgi:hypothetical protein